MIKVLRTLLILLVIGALGYACFVAIDDMYLPDRVFLEEGGSFVYGQGLLTVRADEKILTEASTKPGGSYNGKLYLFDAVPIKTVRVITVDETYLIPGGMTFGVKMFTSGVIVVGMGDIYTAGGSVCPAKDAGLELGDIIESIDGVKVESNENLASLISSGGGQAVNVIYRRAGVRWTTKLTPANAKDGTGYKAGLWVRDSSAGIGTVTYLNPETEMMAGLGHGVTDADTGTVLPVGSGEVVTVTVTGVTKGQIGYPGELKGTFDTRAPFATLLYNCEAGIFAELNREVTAADPIQIGLKQEVRTGPAFVLCTVDKAGPKYYEIEIESVNLSDASPTKNLVVKITDKELLGKTGGIVQGMSGSPIIQNGKIIGAMTHVFVNDPTKGYGIFIENMLYYEKLAANLKNNIAA